MSARPFVDAAVKAGYAVTAIDAFADVQTATVAEKVMVVTYGRSGFDADALMVALDALDLSRFDGFVYGSGFESQPELLLKLAEQLPLIGNCSSTVAAVKTPAVFFAALQRLNINYPDVCYAYQETHASAYLIKVAGGSGGTHVRSANAHDCLLEGEYYYQKKISGRPVSLLFLADKHDIEVVGFNEQWLSPSPESPYRYGGAVSHVELSTSVQQQLINAAQKLTVAFGLLGLNSLDAIVAETESAEYASRPDGEVLVLEINPRLSATFDLYSSAEQNLFERHVNVCLNHDDLNQNAAYQSSLQCKAHAIVYATKNMALSAPIVWPDWMSDTPPLSKKVFTISIGEPVCTVLAYADTANMAKKIAQSRVEIIQNLLQSLNQDLCTNNCVNLTVQSH
ncbi:MAG TPA: ATP-grasp domain-containing protein [Methylotenera sp.]